MMFSLKVNCLFQLGRHREIPGYLKTETSIDKSTTKELVKKIEEIIRQEEENGEEPPIVSTSHHKQECGKRKLFNNYGKIAFEIEQKHVNPRIPNASNAITIDYSFDQGFYLKATQNIQVGDIIVDEPPYASVLLGDYVETHCSECMILLNLFKMNIANCRCCSRVQYCSSECERTAWKNHHQYECKYFNLLGEWPLKV
jgi:hypothetical protein